MRRKKETIVLEKIDVNKTILKEEYRKLKREMETQISMLQREAKEKKIPIIIVFEGFGMAGKGDLINQLIHPLDARGFTVYATEKETNEEKKYPFLWRFWTKTPEKGRITIFDTSWYKKVLKNSRKKEVTQKRMKESFQEIKNFEKQLVDDGTVIIKLFLYISKEEQKKRMKHLLSSKDTTWKVSKEDERCQKHYIQYVMDIDQMIEHTNSEKAPWTIIEAEHRDFATIKVLSTVMKAMQNACYHKGQKDEEEKEQIENNHRENILSNSEKKIQTSFLQQLDLTLKLTDKEYKKRLKAVQNRLKELHNAIYKERIPVILALEGWDAAGKGGVIQRLTEPLDPRGYQVIPISAPNDTERKHHYLWRFWSTLPKKGHISIYDRTWYGRVLVERVEHLCTEQEWKRAYQELNEMEEHVIHEGIVLLKFWLHIDKNEQEKRFMARMNDPKKQWKITEEDWRNREKWEQYEEAINDMILYTSTTLAPWHMIEANDKQYARIKIMETVADTLEREIKKRKNEK